MLRHECSGLDNRIKITHIHRSCYFLSLHICPFCCAPNRPCMWGNCRCYRWHILLGKEGTLSSSYRRNSRRGSCWDICLQAKIDSVYTGCTATPKSRCTTNTMSGSRRSWNEINANDVLIMQSVVFERANANNFVCFAISSRNAAALGGDSMAPLTFVWTSSWAHRKSWKFIYSSTVFVFRASSTTLASSLLRGDVIRFFESTSVKRFFHSLCVCERVKEVKHFMSISHQSPNIKNIASSLLLFFSFLSYFVSKAHTTTFEKSFRVKGWVIWAAIPEKVTVGDDMSQKYPFSPFSDADEKKTRRKVRRK